MKSLVFLLEEPSAKELLKAVVPRIAPADFRVDYKVFEGKQDLEKRLPRILRAWRSPDALFLVMRDQDSGDCHEIKKKLTAICVEAASGRALVRIACRELESFYLGDLGAVERGLSIKGLAKRQKQAKYRAPDALENPATELSFITGGAYQKVAGSRAIGPCLDLEKNTSNSFNVLVAGIRKLIDKSPAI